MNLSNLRIVVSERFVIVNQCSIYKEPDIERTFLFATTNKVGFDWSFAFLAIFAFFAKKKPDQRLFKGKNTFDTSNLQYLI